MKFDIDGDKVLLVGNWGHKNMGDEIILVGNIKLLLKQGKKVYIACSNKDWLKKFHGNFLRPALIENIVYLQELPKGFRSSIRFFKNIKDLKKFFEIDSILIGGGEIFTEETTGSYWYWLASIWIFLFTKKLYLSGGIQIPKKIWNKIPFWIMFKKAKKIFFRDTEFQGRPGSMQKKCVFFPDTSIFVYDDIDLEKYKWIIPSEYKLNSKKEIETDKNGYLQEVEYKNLENKFIVINVNKKAEQFLQEIEEQIEFYYKKDYEVYFVPVCKSLKDQDIVYYHKFKERFSSMKLLDWEKWEDFIKKLSKAEKVFTTRLHLFLVSYYLDLDVKPFVYQKKVEKMKQVLGGFKN